MMNLEVSVNYSRRVEVFQAGKALIQYPLRLVFRERGFAEHDRLEVLIHPLRHDINIIEMFQAGGADKVVQSKNVLVLQRAHEPNFLRNECGNEMSVTKAISFAS
jgi:hypothetical protein